MSGQSYEFLTPEMDRPPGGIAELCRRRLAAEKGFAEIKNKLGEKKAWATSLVAREAQALRIASTHHLPVRYEQEWERPQGVTIPAAARRPGWRVRKQGRP